MLAEVRIAESQILSAPSGGIHVCHQPNNTAREEDYFEFLFRGTINGKNSIYLKSDIVCS